MQTRRRQRQQKIWLGDLLVQKGLISERHLHQALTEQAHTSLKLGEILIQKGLITQKQLQQVLNEQRWQNLATAALLVMGTMASNLPHQINDQPHHQSLSPYHRRHSLAHSARQLGINDFPKGIGGTTISLQQPIHHHPLRIYPTVSSPLKGFCHPLNGVGHLSQGIRGRTHQGRMEYAYDLTVSIGTPVYAMRSGQVIAVRDYYPDHGGSKTQSARFNYVWLEHDDGYRSAYIHLQKSFNRQVNLQVGQWVKAQQLIGYSGNSGWSSGPHLHVEVQQPGEPQRFANTVPFEIARDCHSSQIARQPEINVTERKITVSPNPKH